MPRDYTVPHPKSMRESRLINFFQQQDVFFQYRFWPRWAQVMILLEHKKNNERYNMMCFLMGNGLEGRTAVDWTASYDFYNGVLERGQYDNYAAVDLIQMYQKNQIHEFFQKNKQVYCMVNCRVITM